MAQLHEIVGLGVTSAQPSVNEGASTPASVQGSLGSFTGTYNLTVLNVVNDDFGSYAGDGIDDSWQVQYFGQNNPNAAPNVDFDHTGQTNLFKFVAGLNPLDGSRFLFSVATVPGQPAQKNVIFSPVVGGRTYKVQSSRSLLTPTWSPLTQSAQTDNGNVRTVTDLYALPGPKLYYVQISKP